MEKLLLRAMGLEDFAQGKSDAQKGILLTFAAFVIVSMAVGLGVIYLFFDTFFSKYFGIFIGGFYAYIGHGSTKGKNVPLFLCLNLMPRGRYGKWEFSTPFTKFI